MLGVSVGQQKADWLTQLKTNKSPALIFVSTGWFNQSAISTAKGDIHLKLLLFANHISDN
jgi:hypothetical protein